MTTEIINGIRVLTPADGMWLCDRNAKIISDQVWLGKSDTPDRWEEITNAEKQKLEAKWEAEAEQEILEPEPSPSYAELQEQNEEQKEALRILGVEV